MKKIVAKVATLGFAAALLIPAGAALAAENDAPELEAQYALQTQPAQTGHWMQDPYTFQWWYQYDNGTYPADVIIAITDTYGNGNSNYYCFNSAGYMVTGWVTVDGKTYYFAPSGEMQAGWCQIDGSWYYFTPNSNLAGYPADPNAGVMVTGWQPLPVSNGSNTIGWFYFAPNGVMQVGWQCVGDYWYFLNDGSQSGYALGQMVTGWHWINGSLYYLNELNFDETVWTDTENFSAMIPDAPEGAMAIGWHWMQAPDGSVGWMYFNPSGALVFNPAHSSWFCIDGSWYYINASGIMMTDWVKVGNDWYYLGSDGAMKTGWVLICDVNPDSNGNNWGDDWNWYYLNNGSIPTLPLGAMATGWLTVDGNTYFLNTGLDVHKADGTPVNLPFGAMFKGDYLISNNHYYFNNEGELTGNNPGFPTGGGNFY